MQIRGGQLQQGSVVGGYRIDELISRGHRTARVIRDLSRIAGPNLYQPGTGVCIDGIAVDAGGPIEFSKRSRGIQDLADPRRYSFVQRVIRHADRTTAIPPRYGRREKGRSVASETCIDPRGYASRSLEANP